MCGWLCATWSMHYQSFNDFGSRPPRGSTAAPPVETQNRRPQYCAGRISQSVGYFSSVWELRPHRGSFDLIKFLLSQTVQTSFLFFLLFSRDSDERRKKVADVCARVCVLVFFSSKKREVREKLNGRKRRCTINEGVFLFLMIR